MVVPRGGEGRAESTAGPGGPGDGGKRLGVGVGLPSVSRGPGWSLRGAAVFRAPRPGAQGAVSWLQGRGARLAPFLRDAAAVLRENDIEGKMFIWIFRSSFPLSLIASSALQTKPPVLGAQLRRPHGSVGSCSAEAMESGYLRDAMGSGALETGLLGYWTSICCDLRFVFVVVFCIAS